MFNTLVAVMYHTCELALRGLNKYVVFIIEFVTIRLRALMLFNTSVTMMHHTCDSVCRGLNTCVVFIIEFVTIILRALMMFYTRLTAFLMFSTLCRHDESHLRLGT